VKKLSPLELPQHTGTVWKKIAEEFYSVLQFCNGIVATEGRTCCYEKRVIVEGSF
jgi:hypothetical protein